MINKLPSDFAVFILTNSRPDRVLTYKTLRKYGYTGPIYLIVDNLDASLSKYREIYSDEVIVFDKKLMAKTFDIGDNFNNFRTVTYARNACFGIARKLGIKYFLQLDDDYTRFEYRFDHNNNYTYCRLNNLNEVLSAMLEFYISCSGITSLSMAQGGDFIGGYGNQTMSQKVILLRKCMNSFICSTEREFQFIARLNDDVTTYTRYGQLGVLLCTTNQVSLGQLQTQSNPGGLTEVYLYNGTYVKSFYSVMFSPSCVKIGLLHDHQGHGQNSRIHHAIQWKYCTPKILPENLRKA
jgi:hypothetical protein